MLTKPRKNRIWTKTSHLHLSNISAHKAHLLAVTHQFQTPHGKGLGKNERFIKVHSDASREINSDRVKGLHYNPLFPDMSNTICGAL